MLNRQEHVLSESPIFFNPLANVIGTSLIKYVNMYANSLNTFPIYDQSMQVGFSNTYMLAISGYTTCFFWLSSGICFLGVLL